MYFIPLNYDVIVSRAALTKIFSAYIPRSALSAFRDSPQVCFTDNTALKSVNCTKAQSIDSVSESQISDVLLHKSFKHVSQLR